MMNEEGIDPGTVASEIRYATALFPWSGPGDRFLRAGYRDGLSVVDRVRRAGGLGVLDGVELVYPFEVNEENQPYIKEILDAEGLVVAALGTTISSERRFGKGALTARDPDVRRAAVHQVKSGMDVCAGLGCDRVFFFLGQDGCDYPLEVDYEDSWNWLVEGITEIASHRDDIRICLEYKPFEPRRHIFFNDVGTALFLVEQVGLNHVGVLFDTGHAMMAGENLGESIVLLHRKNRLFHVHFNDNYRNWDDDMIVGSLHLFPYIEAVYWLRRVGYSGWRSLDLFPYREDPDLSVVQSIKFIKYLEGLIDTIGLDTITKLLHQGDGSKTIQELNRHVLGIE